MLEQAFRPQYRTHQRPPKSLLKIGSLHNKSVGTKFLEHIRENDYLFNPVTKIMLLERNTEKKWQEQKILNVG